MRSFDRKAFGCTVGCVLELLPMRAAMIAASCRPCQALEAFNEVNFKVKACDSPSIAFATCSRSKRACVSMLPTHSFYPNELPAGRHCHSLAQKLLTDHSLPAELTSVQLPCTCHQDFNLARGLADVRGQSHHVSDIACVTRYYNKFF